MPSSVHDPIYREFIARIVAARLGARLTQEAVAKRLGRPQSYIAKIEGCERRIDVVELLRLADAIGVNPMPLLRWAWKQLQDERQG